MFSKMIGLIFQILLRKVDLSSEWFGHEIRKWEVVSTYFPNCKMDWKLCLNLCSRRWLNPSRSLVIKFTPIGSWQNIFGSRPYNFKIVVSEFRVFELISFHSIMVDGKFVFLKNWCFTPTYCVHFYINN